MRKEASPTYISYREVPLIANNSAAFTVVSGHPPTLMHRILAPKRSKLEECIVRSATHTEICMKGAFSLLKVYSLHSQEPFLINFSRLTTVML